MIRGFLIRRPANYVFMSIATRKRNETLRLWPGSAASCEAIGAVLAYTGQNRVFAEPETEYCRFT